MTDDGTQPAHPGFKRLGDVLPKPKKLGCIKQRLIERSADFLDSDPRSILYQHTVLCQTVMPYRDPGKDTRLWQRTQGRAKLEIQAGRAYDDRIDNFVDVGLPFGPKPRIVLFHLNAEALRIQSPLIEVEDSLTAFVKRIGLDPKGRNMRIIKDQLSRFSASDFRFGLLHDGKPTTIKVTIISGFQLWFPKDDCQRVLWPTTVRFSQEYFESLMTHAVPLNESAIALLSHSAMALDVYAWLAQRLHRIPPGRPQFIPWTAAKDQFGHGYKRIRKFREVFLEALRQVRTVYPDARLDIDGHGLTLSHSRPPIPRRLLPLS